MTHVFLAIFLWYIARPADPSAPTPQVNAQNTKYSTEFDWSQPLSTNLGAAGAKVVILSSCPAGVKGTEKEYWVYIFGAGTPEAVQITGGTCAGDSNQGTLQFTTARDHSGGSKIGSASSGFQEASIAAQDPQGGKVVVPSGTDLRVYAPVSIRSSNQTVDFTGSTLECYTDESCVIVGDRNAPSYTFSGITLINPRGRPMVPRGARSMIEVNAQKTRVLNVMSRSSSSGTFGHFVQVDDDEAFLLDGVDPSVGDELRCDPTFCGSVVYAPGPFGGPHPRAAVGYLKHMNLTMNSKGNCVDWQSGNTVRIEDSVCQGFSQFGIRGGVSRGGYGGMELDNVYFEEYQGNGANPLGNIGQAGIIMQGGRLTIHSDRVPGGSQGSPFTRVGSTIFHYWIVASHSKMGDSVPLPLGWAKTDGVTPVPVKWPLIPGVAGAGRYKVLRLVWDGHGAKPVPNGTGNWLVGTVDPATCEAICTFTDKQGAPNAYTTVSQIGGPPPYYPLLELWPGNIVLSSSADSNVVGIGATATADFIPNGIVSVNRFVDGPQIIGMKFYSGGIEGPDPAPNYVAIDQNFASSPTYLLKNGLLLPSKASPFDGGQFINHKGKINFFMLGTAPAPLITWEDSNPNTTLVDVQRRPAADPADSDTGMFATGILYNRAKTGIRSYIGTLPDSTSWKEQLTAEQKIFAVSVKVKEGSSFTLGAGSPLSQMKVFTTGDISGSGVPPQSCVDATVKVDGLAKKDQIAGVTPPGKLGNVSLNAYASAPDVLTLHFCNPSALEVTTPAGAYSFLALH